MRIVIDLDGTICPVKEDGDNYADLKPYPGAVEKLRMLRAVGHYIIIQTARNMKTCESNVGKVMRNVGRVTFEWLDKYQIPYDEIYFGKPNAEVYIDDRAFRFSSWHEISDELLCQNAKAK